MRRALLALLALTSAFSPACRNADEVVIGVMGPLSGPRSSVGIEMKRGATLAAKHINRRGGIDGKTVRISFHDDSDPARIIGQMRDLARRGPAAVIGPESIATVASSNNALSAAGIASLLIGASEGSVGRNPAVYRLTPSNAAMVASLAGWFADVRGFRRVALVSDGTAWGRDGVGKVNASLQRRGIEVTASTEIAESSADPTVVMQGLRESSPEAVVMWLRPAAAAKFAGAVRAAGWEVQLAGPDALIDPEFRSLAGSASDDVVIAAPRIAEERWFAQDLRDWVVDYNQEFSVSTIKGQRTLVSALPYHAISAYDAVGVITAAVQRAGSSEPEKVATALESTEAFEGILTTYDLRDREAFSSDQIEPARLYNLALVYDLKPGFDLERQVAFYKIQVSGYYLPDAYLQSAQGQQLQYRVLEEVLTDPEAVEFFKPYRAPRPPPGRI